jgi:hypothetical protein
MKTVATTLCSLALVAALAVPTFANPTFGPINGVYRSPAFGAGIHRITYNANEQADFSINGDHDTALNITVRDAFGNFVVGTTGPGDIAHVSWTPRQTQTYTIYVTNSGSVYNQYSYRAY